jgi:hypothetical protein
MEHHSFSTTFLHTDNRQKDFIYEYGTSLFFYYCEIIIVHGESMLVGRPLPINLHPHIYMLLFPYKSI